MTAPALFPGHVESFIQQLEAFLAFENAQLTLVSESAEASRRDYEVRIDAQVTKVVIHRTLDSLDQQVGRYRARAFTDLPDELTASCRGKEDATNRYASLGALVTTEKSSAVYSQCIIQEDYTQVLAAMFASAAIHAATAIIQSIQKAISGNQKGSVQTLSAWTDIDFESLRYDLAHYGTASIAERGIRVIMFPHGSLEITATHENPYWGGGLLSLLAIHGKSLVERAPDISANDLNSAEFFFGNAPMFGGWCKADDDYVFVSFAPNYLKSLPIFTQYFVRLARDRYRQLNDVIALCLIEKERSRAS